MGNAVGKQVGPASYFLIERILDIFNYKPQTSDFIITRKTQSIQADRLISIFKQLH